MPSEPASIHKLPKGRPIQIGLVNLGGALPISLEAFARTLNKEGKELLFAFNPIPTPIADLGPPDRAHAHSDKALFELIDATLDENGFVFGIGITDQELEEGRFDSHDQEAGVGVITIDNFLQYNPKGRTLEQYLAFLVLCEAYCITARQHFEHPHRVFCLFDLCIKKEDLRRCLEKPYIHCGNQLKEAGFTDSDLEGSEEILKFVKKPDWTYVFGETVSHPFVGFFLGALTVNLLSNLIASFGSQASWIVTVILIVGFAFAFFSRLTR